MEGILKRLVALNQLLLVLFVLCFLSWSGRRASIGALDVARDLEALSLLKGKDRDPSSICASDVVQESVDAAVQEGADRDAYRKLREAFTAFLRDRLQFGDDEIARAKRGDARAYFFVSPRLSVTANDSRPCPFAAAAPAVGDDLPGVTPDSVDTVLARSYVFAKSQEVQFPTEWTPPNAVGQAVPQRCLVSSTTSTTGAAAHAQSQSRSMLPPAPRSFPTPPPVSTTRRAGAPRAAAPPSADPATPAPPPESIVSESCKLERVYFDGEMLNLAWRYEPPPQTQEAGWEETLRVPAKGKKQTLDRPFLLASLSSIEDGWRSRFGKLADEDGRRQLLTDRYGGLAIDNAREQSYKVYSDLVGSVTLFGWNLLPEWFPLAVGVTLAILLLAIFATCRAAQKREDAAEKGELLAVMESVFVSSLSTPIATVISWVLIPAATLVLSFSRVGAGASFLAGAGLTAIASVLGAWSCALFWRASAAARPVPVRPAAVE